MSTIAKDANHCIVSVLAGCGTRLPAHVGIITALKKLRINYRPLQIAHMIPLLLDRIIVDTM